MKYSLVSLLVLSFCTASAQLNVRNNAYVYVNDQVLFVNDNVNLQEANSKIYLREEAQLIQGTGTTGNSGVGELSVYQTGNVNQWSYNYWCSPVGNNSTALGNENARVDLIDDATGLTTSNDALFTSGYNGISSPLTISDRWLWTYQTSDQYIDWVYVGSSGPIKPGLGFTMKGNGLGVTGSQVYDFRGKPNNGTIENDVANGLNTLIGNPYPSALDAAAFIWDPANQASISGELLFWEQSGTVPSHVLQAYQGGYYSFTINESGTMITDAFAVFNTYDEQDNSFPLPIPTNGNKIQGRYIPIGQGFMVVGNSGTPGSPAKVFTRNSHRAFEKESDGNSFFFRNTTYNSDNTIVNETAGIQYQDNGLSIVPENYKRFRINIDFTKNEAQYTRQLVLNFHDSATAGFDYGLELTLSENLESDGYFILDEERYLGQAYPFSQDLSIPLILDIEQQQPLTFRIFDIQNFEESQGIYIHDIENGVYVNLRNQNYELNIAPGNYTDRFEIVFTTEQDALDIETFESNTLLINQINRRQELSVRNPKGLDVNKIEIYDVSGKRLLEKQYNTISDHYELSTSNLSDGVYVVNVLSKTNNTIQSQKIIVKN